VAGIPAAGVQPVRTKAGGLTAQRETLQLAPCRTQTEIRRERPDGARWPAGLPGAARVHVASEEEVEMRADFDFSPLVRSTVGFDRITVRSHLNWQVEKPR